MKKRKGMFRRLPTSNIARTVYSTIVKPGKKGRTKVKAYRPIPLLNTLGKGLEAAIAQKITFAVEKF
jgi:hypothetical protein